MKKLKKYQKYLFTAVLVVLCLVSLLIPGGKASETTAPTTVPVTTKPAVNNSTSLRPGPKLKAHFIDVGQADSILLECEGSYALIDAGYPQSGKIVVDYLKELGVSRLDLVVGTHPHGDHIGGLPKVLKEFKADNIWSGPITYYNNTVYDFLNAAKAQNEEVQYVKPGTTFQLGGATIEVLGPVKDNYEDINDLSLVLMVTYGNIKYLLTGDMESVAEKDLVNSGVDLKADLLKVGHHGSYSSSSYVFLREVLPTYGVIMCGRNNDYGHPHDAALGRLQNADVSIYRVDQMGTVIATTDGRGIFLSWAFRDAKPWTPAA